MCSPRTFPPSLWSDLQSSVGGPPAWPPFLALLKSPGIQRTWQPPGRRLQADHLDGLPWCRCGLWAMDSALRVGGLKLPWVSCPLFPPASLLALFSAWEGRWVVGGAPAQHRQALAGASQPPPQHVEGPQDTSSRALCMGGPCPSVHRPHGQTLWGLSRSALGQLGAQGEAATLSEPQSAPVKMGSP